MHITFHHFNVKFPVSSSYIWRNHHHFGYITKLMKKIHCYICRQSRIAVFNKHRNEANTKPIHLACERKLLSKCPIQESKRLKNMWESCAVTEAFLNYSSALSNAKKTQVLLIVSNLSTVEILRMKMPPPLCEVVSLLNRKITLSPVAFWVRMTHHSGGRTLHSIKTRASLNNYQRQV